MRVRPISWCQQDVLQTLARGRIWLIVASGWAVNLSTGIIDNDEKLLKKQFSVVKTIG